MKTRIFLITSALVLLFSSGLLAEEVKMVNQANQPGQVNILYSEELQGLTGEWAREYQNQHPDIRVSMAAANRTESITSPDQVAFMSGSNPADIPGWRMAVGRDVIVPVINSNNPSGSLLAVNGVSQEKIRQLFLNTSGQAWSTIIENGQNNPVHLYIINDPTVISAVKQYLEINALSDNIRILDNNDQMLLTVKNDPLALGFCKLSGIIEPGSQKFAENIRIMPIDRNDNGKLDYIEDIYEDAEAFSRGVWIGKYPKSLIKDIYAITSSQPSGEAQIAFLTWVLTDGQKSLAAFGFSNLIHSEVQSKIDKIAIVSPDVPLPQEAISAPKLALFIIAALLLLGILFSAFFGFRREEKNAIPDGPDLTRATFDERTIITPGGLFYDKSHTWAFMEKDGSVKVGIDDFLQHVTGIITRIEMKKPGEKVVKGELFLSLIQHGKQINLYAPVSGTIRERNSLLDGNTSVLNTSPYGDGWIYRIEPANWLQEISLLNMAGKYKKWLSGEFIRLKDFLAFSLQTHRLDYFQVILQDGGELKNNLLEDLGPEVWEDFQSKFIDTYK